MSEINLDNIVKIRPLATKWFNSEEEKKKWLDDRFLKEKEELGMEKAFYNWQDGWKRMGVRAQKHEPSKTDIMRAAAVKTIPLASTAATTILFKKLMEKEAKEKKSREEALHRKAEHRFRPHKMDEGSATLKMVIIDGRPATLIPASAEDDQ